MGKTDFFSKNNDFKKNYIFISYILLVSNLTNKYNPQELLALLYVEIAFK